MATRSEITGCGTMATVTGETPIVSCCGRTTTATPGTPSPTPCARPTLARTCRTTTLFSLNWFLSQAPSINSLSSNTTMSGRPSSISKSNLQQETPHLPTPSLLPRMDLLLQQIWLQIWTAAFALPEGQKAISFLGLLIWNHQQEPQTVYSRS